jgi:hypothetical protein
VLHAIHTSHQAAENHGGGFSSANAKILF